jgi:hypothetical protein
MKYIDICIVLLTLLLCICFYRKEKYDTREGLFASLITERQKSDGTTARQGVHFMGTEDPSGEINIEPTNEGVINTSHLKFLDTFYGGDNESLILSYARDPRSYPSYSAMNRLSETSLEEIEAELATAQQEALNAYKRVEDITNELTTNRQNLVPINSENASNLEKIDRLKTQLSTAQQQAQEAEQKYQSEMNRAKGASGISVFADMFKKTNAPVPPPEPAAPPPPDPNVSQNGRCGWANNNKRCPAGQCCSNNGWCGGSQLYNIYASTADDWCSREVPQVRGLFTREARDLLESGAIDRFYHGTQNGKFDGDPIPLYPISTDGRCGPSGRTAGGMAGQNVVCPANQCCGQGFKCGGTRGTKETKWCFRAGGVGHGNGKWDGSVVAATPPPAPSNERWYDSL